MLTLFLVHLTLIILMYKFHTKSEKEPDMTFQTSLNSTVGDQKQKGNIHPLFKGLTFWVKEPPTFPVGVYWATT